VVVARPIPGRRPVLTDPTPDARRFWYWLDPARDAFQGNYEEPVHEEHAEPEETVPELTGFVY
jgi:hypothetical protein